MKKLMNYFLNFVFLTVIFSLCVSSVIANDRTSSKIENRPLASFPSFNWSDFTSGKFFGGITNYVSDQLFMRDQIVGAYQSQQQSALFNTAFFSNGDKKDHTGTVVKSAKLINNLLLINNEWILGGPKKQTNYPALDAAVESVNNIAKVAQRHGTEVDFILNPDKSLALSHLYPTNMQFDTSAKEKERFIKQISPTIHLVDEAKMMSSMTLKQKEDMYFKTDHHWKITGAFPAYQYAVDQLSKQSEVFHEKPLSLSDIDILRLNGSFYGSFNAEVQNIVDPKVEKTAVYLPKKPFSFSKFEAVSVEGKVSDDFGKFYAAGMKNPGYTYGEVYCGDQQSIFFENPHAGNKLKALMLKDSYADAALPFYAEHFYQLTVIDNRYTTSFDLEKLLKEKHYDMLILQFKDDNIFLDNKGNYAFTK